MIKKDNERIIEIKEHLKDGEGNVIFKKIATPDEMYKDIKKDNPNITDEDLEKYFMYKFDLQKQKTKKLK